MADTISPIAPVTALTEVTDQQLSAYADLVYAKTGIRISPQKRTLLSNRVRRRLRETRIASFEAYLNHLRGLPSSHPEWDAFLQEITTHETYLFRDEAQWNWFRGTYLKERAEAARQPGGKRGLRIWSAAASTGDEAYTIATCVSANLPDLATWNVQIVGSDIGVGALEQAKEALFNERAMRQVPEDLRRRYFQRVAGSGVWQPTAALRSLVRFRRHNLLERWPEPPFDLVFLKNVLIYFDHSSKMTVLRQIRAAIRPGGLLVTGAAEGVSELLKDARRLQPWLFRMPE